MKNMALITPPCLNLHYSRPTRGDASRIHKHENLLKVDINDIHKQEHQSMITPNNVTNISKSEGDECVQKKHRTKNWISNLVAQTNSRHIMVAHGDE